MDIHEYIPLALRTASEKPVLGIQGVDIKLSQALHACIGLSGEILEMVNYAAENDENSLAGELEEAGDCLWYCALGMHACGADMTFAGRSLPFAATPDEAEDGFADLMKSIERIHNWAKRVLFYGYLKDDKDMVELGDLFWGAAGGLSRFCYALQTDAGKVMESNIRKLQKRYPDRFSVEGSINRDLEVEKVAMR